MEEPSFLHGRSRVYSSPKFDFPLPFFLSRENVDCVRQERSSSQRCVIYFPVFKEKKRASYLSLSFTI